MVYICTVNHSTPNKEATLKKDLWGFKRVILLEKLDDRWIVRVKGTRIITSYHVSELVLEDVNNTY
jgi:hypothetical protein